MEQKQRLMTVVLLGIVMLAGVIPFLSFVSAADLTENLTWNPLGGTTNYTNHTGSFSFNCTTGKFRVTNLTVYANSSAGIMNALQSFANTTKNQTAWTGTVTITAADDGTYQNLSCYPRNNTADPTAYTAENLARDVILDTTAPKCNITILHPTIAYGGLQTITYYSSDALARRLTTLDIDGPGKQTLVSVTAQSRTIELTSNDTKYTGSWTVNMTVTDWSGNSCTDSATFKSYMPDGQGQIPSAPTGGNMKGILLIVGLAVLAYFVFGKKK